MKRNTAGWVVGVLLVLGAASWMALRPAPAEKGKGKAGSGSVQVEVVRVQQTDVPLEISSSGQVTPLQTLEVRPQVSGVVSRVHFREGQTVKAGALLFELEDGAERAVLGQARAQLQKGKAQLDDARRTLSSNEKLQAQGFIAPQAVASSRSAVEALKATVEADKAGIRAAESLLTYKTIRAAVGGRAGLVNVYPGSVVSLSMATPMVSITQLDPIAVSFTVAERDLPRVVAAHQAGVVSVNAILPDQPQRVFVGRLSFIDNSIDAASGTLRLKAEFPNANQALWPGLFVTINLQAGVQKNVVVLPLAGLQTGPEGKFVYRLEGDKVRAQPVEVLGIRNEQAIVKGLAADSVIVTRGGLNVRSGDRVTVAGRKKTSAAASGRSKGDAR